MTLQDVIDELMRGIRSGKLDPDMGVKMRSTAISEEMMEAGSDGYVEVEEILAVEGVAHLLVEVY